MVDGSIFYAGNRGRRNRQAVVAHNHTFEEERRARIDPELVAQRVSAEIAERQEAEQAAVRAAESELSRNLAALRNEQRHAVQNSTDDQSIFADPNEPKMFASQAEADAYNRREVSRFLADTPAYYADPEGKNQATIGAYLERNGHGVIVSARKLRQVFERLSSLGLMIPRPPAPQMDPALAPVTAARAPRAPQVWDVDSYPYFQNPGGKASDLITGYDPAGSGERVTLTRRAVEMMDPREFKFFGRPTVQVKPEWARVEDREMMARQFTELGRRISSETE